MDSTREVTFQGDRCRLSFGQYSNGALAILLVDAANGEHVACATVNVVSHVPAPGFVLVKDWNENKGMLAALQEGAIVEDTGQRVQTGFVQAAICRLLVEVP